MTNRKPIPRKNRDSSSSRPPASKGNKRTSRSPKSGPPDDEKDKAMRLNRYIAHCGICGRREADQLIQQGDIYVNGKPVTAMGIKVIPGVDTVLYKGKKITPEKKVYVLYNKPKNEITTAKDPRGRTTVMDSLKRVTKERIFPVGRLDRNTTGLLLLTNDGDLAKKLTHPSHQVRKVYKIKLDKPVDPEHLELLKNGITLEDGKAKVDKISYIEGSENREIGLEIHIGRNRIVRRMFETLGYKVQTLDRTMLGHLTKKKPS